MTADSHLLLLTGSHPAAAWLANWLAGRGQAILWGASSQAAYAWWALSPHAFAAYGEPLPNWPLEWTHTCTQALALFHAQHGLHLSARESIVVDLSAMSQELQRTLQQRQIPQSSLWQSQRAELKSETGSLQARWCIEINFSACPACQGWEYSGELDQAASAAGLLESHRLAGGELWVCNLGNQRSAFSYQAATPHHAMMQADLESYWPGYQGEFKAENWHPVCHCPPRLAQTERHLLLQISPPSLHPRAQLAQALVWLAVQALGRWLSEDGQILETLDRDWQAYLNKVSAAPVRLGQIHKFPGDPA
ncbi:MAG: hypothetical protein ACO1RX_21410 [Candidatus Sericytochromatia bacterium]